MRRAAEAIGAGVRASPVAVDGIIEADIRALVMRDDGARFRLFKDFDSGFGRLAQPLDRVLEPGIGRIFYVTHVNFWAGAFLWNLSLPV